jgi:hypothetical protein
MIMQKRMYNHWHNILSIPWPALVSQLNENEGACVAVGAAYSLFTSNVIKSLNQ